MDFISILSIFVLACFVGYYVVWSVTPALHTPLMAVTNAISSVIIVGALIAVGGGRRGLAKGFGLLRRGFCQRQHLRRLPGHPAHAGDVQEEGALMRRAQLPWGVALAYLGRGRFVHSGAARAVEPGDQPRRATASAWPAWRSPSLTTLALYHPPMSSAILEILGGLGHRRRHRRGHHRPQASR
jgi:hypothetical protein